MAGPWKCPPGGIVPAAGSYGGGLLVDDQKRSGITTFTEGCGGA